MKRKLEDQLAKLAFGDVSPEEAARIEALAATDPEAAKTLTAYRRMKVDLQDLYEVPQEQLSKERLRDAILARGLKETAQPQPKKSWLWMPTAAATLAFGLMFVKMQNPSTQVPVVANLTESSLSGINLLERNSLDKPVDFSSLIDTTELESEKVQVKTALDAPERADKRPVRKKVRIKDRNRGGELVARNEIQGPPIIIASNETPIILIQPEKDGETGAQKATEVENASNVLVGG